ARRRTAPAPFHRAPGIGMVRGKERTRPAGTVRGCLRILAERLRTPPRRRLRSAYRALEKRGLDRGVGDARREIVRQGFYRFPRERDLTRGRLDVARPLPRGGSRRR